MFVVSCQCGWGGELVCGFVSVGVVNMFVCGFVSVCVWVVSMYVCGFVCVCVCVGGGGPECMNLYVCVHFV